VARFLKNIVFSMCFGLVGGGANAAANDVCQNLAGKTVFVDMLYGVAGGALFSGLYMVASDNYEKGGSKAAYGALAGGTLGVGVGLVEVFSRKCEPQSFDKSAAIQSKNSVSLFAAPTTRSSKSLLGISFSRNI